MAQICTENGTNSVQCRNAELPIIVTDCLSAANLSVWTGFCAVVRNSNLLLQRLSIQCSERATCSWSNRVHQALPILSVLRLRSAFGATYDCICGAKRRAIPKASFYCPLLAGVAAYTLTMRGGAVPFSTPHLRSQAVLHRPEMVNLLPGTSPSQPGGRHFSGSTCEA
jgi:hypothetical protein